MISTPADNSFPRTDLLNSFDRKELERINEESFFMDDPALKYPERPESVPMLPIELIGNSNMQVFPKQPANPGLIPVVPQQASLRKSSKEANWSSVPQFDQSKSAKPKKGIIVKTLIQDEEFQDGNQLHMMAGSPQNKIIGRTHTRNHSYNRDNPSDKKARSPNRIQSVNNPWMERHKQNQSPFAVPSFGNIENPVSHPSEPRKKPLTPLPINSTNMLPNESFEEKKQTEISNRSGMMNQMSNRPKTVTVQQPLLDDPYENIPDEKLAEIISLNYFSVDSMENSYWDRMDENEGQVIKDAKGIMDGVINPHTGMTNNSIMPRKPRKSLQPLALRSPKGLSQRSQVSKATSNHLKVPGQKIGASREPSNLKKDLQTGATPIAESCIPGQENQEAKKGPVFDFTEGFEVNKLNSPSNYLVANTEGAEMAQNQLNQAQEAPLTAKEDWDWLEKNSVEMAQVDEDLPLFAKPSFGYGSNLATTAGEKEQEVFPHHQQQPSQGFSFFNIEANLQELRNTDETENGVSKTVPYSSTQNKDGSNQGVFNSPPMSFYHKKQEGQVAVGF